MRHKLIFYCGILVASIAALCCSKSQTPGQSQAAASSERYTVNAEGIVHDGKTDLEWVIGPDERTGWDQAKKWVESLTMDGGGWRMPTKEELRGLYGKGLGTRNMTPLLKTTGWWMWSSAESEGSSAGWGFSFSRDGELVMTSRAFCESRAIAVRVRK